jgi:GNAT superfamily N-acetyltransferase
MPSQDEPDIPSSNQSTYNLPHGGRLTLRSAAESDEPFLLALYGTTREDELAQVVWPEGQKEIFVRWQFDMQRREYQARFPNASYEVILVDGSPVGRFWTARDDEQIRLLDIALLPEFQRRGIGTLLLQRLIREALQAQKPLRHMVFVLNNDAHRFYERLDFVVIEDFGAYKHMEWRPAQTEQTQEAPRKDL